MSGRIRLSLVMLLCLCSGTQAGEPKRDRFGDPLPEGAIARLGSLHWRHESAVLTAAFMADGKTLVTGHADSISFWDLNTGKSVRRVPLQVAPTGGLRRLSSDGKVLMLEGHDNVLHFVDAASGAEQRSLNHAQCGRMWGQLELSRDGKILAAVHPGSIALWEVAGGKLLHEFKEPSLAQAAPPSLIALTPDGKQLVRPHADGSLHLVDVASGKEVRAFEMPPTSQRTPPPFHFPRLALSPDGRYLAFGGYGIPWTVCELATGKRLCQLGATNGFVSGLAFTPNGRFLAVDRFNEVGLFGVLSGKEIRKLSKKTPGSSTMLAFSPDGRTMAEFPSASTIRLWDLISQRRLHPPVGHDGGVRSLAFFPDGKRLVSANQTGELKVWDIASSQTLAERTYNSGALPLAVDRDGECVRFALFNSAHHWDPRTGREEVRPRVEVGLSTNKSALSPDGRSLAVQCYNTDGNRQKPVFTYQLRLYDLKTGKYLTLPALPLPGEASQMLFTPDSRCLAVYYYDGALRLWGRDTGKLVHEFKRERLVRQPVHLAFAADGRSLLTMMDGMVRIREIASGADRLQIPPAPGSLLALAYSPDARLIACGGWDGRIFVYSAVSGKPLAQWQGKQGSIYSLAFSHDSRYLASGGANGTILVWKMPQDDSAPVVRNAKEAASSWRALGASDATAANRALAGLAASPAEALPLFRERLPSLGKELDSAQLRRWIAELDDDSFKVREQATRELASAGEDAADALRHALQSSPSAESKRRIEDLLSRLKKGGDSRRLRFVRSIEALERIGSPQAKDVLRSLAGKSLSPDLREEVQASLRRLYDKP